MQSGCQWKDFRRAARNLAAIPNTGGSIPQKKQLRGHKLLAQEKGTSNAPTPALSKKAAPNKGRHIHFFGKGPRFSCHWGAPPRDHPARRAARPPKAQWATNRNAPTPPRRAAIATSPKGRNIDRNSAATSIKGKLNSAVALANLTGTIQAQWAATLISFGLCLPLLVEVFDHPLGSAWKRFAEKCRIYPPQALPMQVLNSAILSITLVLPVSSLMYRRRLPVGEQFRQYDIPFCVLMALILLLPPLVKKRLYRWQGRVCLILYVMYLAAVLIMPRAGA